jgi:hypothetical protein
MQKKAVFWDVVPYSLVDTDRCFRGANCLLQSICFSALKRKYVRDAETSDRNI